MVLDYLKDIIFSDNPTFYISKGGIVICFSSYELDPSISDLSTFKISFEEDRSYLRNNRYLNLGEIEYGSIL